VRAKFESSLHPLLAELVRAFAEARGASLDYALNQQDLQRQDSGHDGRSLHPHEWRENLGATLAELDGRIPDAILERHAARKIGHGKFQAGWEVETLSPIKILRGHLVPIRDVPSPIVLTQKVIAFITINGSDDLLDRHLHQGIHYHYALRNRVHTTTLICWDTRWKAVAKKAKRPLFHEMHATGAKSKTARPLEWGDKKRQSIWDACHNDIGSRDISEFRCASDRAESVWPRNVTVTAKR